MNQECAIDSRPTLSSTNSPRLGGTLLPLLSLLVISGLPLLGAATDGSDARYNDLGHRMFCTCESEPASGVGVASPCKQVLLECNHLNCNVSDHMRSELRAALQRGDKDDVILQSFVQEYGTSVLAAAPAVDKLVWLMALVAVIAIVSFVLAFVRKRRPTQVTTSK